MHKKVPTRKQNECFTKIPLFTTFECRKMPLAFSNFYAIFNLKTICLSLLSFAFFLLKTNRIPQLFGLAKDYKPYCTRSMLDKWFEIVAISNSNYADGKSGGILFRLFVCWICFCFRHFQMKKDTQMMLCTWMKRARLIELRIWIVFNEHEALDFCFAKLQPYLFANAFEDKINRYGFHSHSNVFHPKKMLRTPTFLLPSIAIII